VSERFADLSLPRTPIPHAVTISKAVPRGVVLVHKGRWPKLEASGSKVNTLNPGQKTDLAESSAVHSVEVGLAPVDQAAVGATQAP
jgi:hypothetical protein